MRKVVRLVHHCTATSQDVRVASIQRYWKEQKGWKSPGYHIIIKADGSYVRLAGDHEIVNGAKGYNSDSIHISYIGGIDSKGKPMDTRTPEQKATQLALTKAYLKKYPGIEVTGHRDLKGVAKACPSFDVKQWLKEVL